MLCTCYQSYTIFPFVTSRRLSAAFITFCARSSDMLSTAFVSLVNVSENELAGTGSDLSYPFLDSGRKHIFQDVPVWTHKDFRRCI